MSDETKIAPALTPEEWARAGNAQELSFGADGWVTAKASRTDAYRDGALNVKASDRLPALIALANAALPDDDPRKITREWIDRMRRASAYCYGLAEPGDTILGAAMAIYADALESYLPLETP